MKRILILCEGQTEETFVKRIMDPHLWEHGKTIIPVLVSKKTGQSERKYKGGVTSYERIRKDVLNLLKDKDAVCVTTMLDYYGLPSDFPGKKTLTGNTPYQRVQYLEQEFARNIQDPRFLPYLSLHEFEALLLVCSQAISEVTGQNLSGKPLWNPASHSSPEEIDEGKHTHPSALILKAVPHYRKTLHGSLIAEKIGLSQMRTHCPHFDEWLRQLENL